jgi:hypothetical protein
LVHGRIVSVLRGDRRRRVDAGAWHNVGRLWCHVAPAAVIAFDAVDAARARIRRLRAMLLRGLPA